MSAEIAQLERRLAALGQVVVEYERYNALLRDAARIPELETRLALAEAAERMIVRSGLRVAWCMYCGLPCLAGEKRSFCCGDATTDTDPSAPDTEAEPERRLCSRSFASHPENHIEDIGVDGWGRCVSCGETVNVSGAQIPEHRVPAAPPIPNTGDGSCICPRFHDTGGFRLADLGCPIHGVEGTDPGDGHWQDAAAPDTGDRP